MILSKWVGSSICYWYFLTLTLIWQLAALTTILQYSWDPKLHILLNIFSHAYLFYLNTCVGKEGGSNIEDERELDLTELCTTYTSYATTLLSWTTPTLFIKRIIIIIDHTILILIPRVKNICDNKLVPILDNFSMFSCNFMKHIDLGYLFKVKTIERKNIPRSPW